MTLSGFGIIYFKITFCTFRWLNLREGYSQIQITLLASDKKYLM